MFVWCGILFLLGIAAFLDSIFNYGDIFRQVNSTIFMLIALALLVRTTSKMKERTFEKYENIIKNLEKELDKLKEEKELIENDYK